MYVIYLLCNINVYIHIYTTFQIITIYNSLKLKYFNKNLRKNYKIVVSILFFYFKTTIV